MSNIEQFCFLVVQRQKANMQRRRLLYALNKKLKSVGGKNRWSRHHIKIFACKDELAKYRNHADSMKQIAKTHYSPLRREVNAKVIYDSNNNCQYVEHNEIIYSYSKVKQMADAYHFDTIVLDRETVENPYREL